MSDKSSAFRAVVADETDGRAAIGDRISSPLASGKSGWTIGLIQQDFNTNSDAAQATLNNALVASGRFDASNAEKVGEALTAAGTSSRVNLSGITDINGNAVNISSINSALATSPAAQSIANDGLDSFSSEWNTVTAVISNSSTSWC